MGSSHAGTIIAALQISAGTYFTTPVRGKEIFLLAQQHPSQ